MAVKITYFSHGTTSDNENGISSGWKDVDLSEKGIKESMALGKRIKGRHFDAVFCSDLKRAMHTAELVWDGGVPITSDKRLRECNYGKFNGMPSYIVTPMQQKCISKRFPEGESYRDVQKRVVAFLEFLKQRYAGKDIAIVSHKAPRFVLEIVLNKRTWKRLFAERYVWKPGWKYTLE